MNSRTQQREKQAATVYHYIERYIDAHGHSPNYDEIAAGCYMARSTVLRYLDLLEGRGHITRTPHIARSIRVARPLKP